MLRGLHPMKHDVRRRLEQYAANPRCQANARSAVSGVSMASVASSLGLPAAFGQSPFALARGQQFERGLFHDDAQRLRRALVEQKVLPANAAGLHDLRLTRNGGPIATLDAACAGFEQFLRGAAALTSDARMQIPTLVAGATVTLDAQGFGEGVLALDVLTVHPAPRPAPITLRVGEVKVYPDRGGFTDAQQLASARAQAGLYVHALRRALGAFKLTREFAVADDGFLVLARASSNFPSVRAGEDLRHQAKRAATMLTQVNALGLPPTDTVDDPVKAIADAPHAYGDVCLSFCELADRCQQEALSLGLPNALGDDLARALGTVPLHRALELLRGATPATAAEQDLVRRAL